MTTERRGLLQGAAAFFLWGLFPLYWPLLKPAGAVEVLAHRVVWSLFFVGALLWWRGRRQAGSAGVRTLRALVGDPRRFGLLALAAGLIGSNWLVYIWAVSHSHVVDTSLGYFINPLIVVALAVGVLGERLRPRQAAALAVAGVGVVVLTVQAGALPWIALLLAGTFGSYGLIKKTVGIGATQGLAVETAVLFVPAALWLSVTVGTGQATVGRHGAGHTLLLLGAGVVTAVPLLLFAAAAGKVPLVTLGLLQYIAPVLQFGIGVVVAGEPLPPLRLTGFAVIWVALFVLTVDGLGHRRRAGKALAPVPVPA